MREIALLAHGVHHVDGTLPPLIYIINRQIHLCPQINTVLPVKNRANGTIIRKNLFVLPSLARVTHVLPRHHRA